MSSPAGSNITSVLKEARKFLPSKDFSANAHIKNIYSKFALHGRTAVVAEAVRRGFIRRERSSA